MMVLDFAEKIKARLPEQLLELHHLLLRETETSFACLVRLRSRPLKTLRPLDLLWALRFLL